MICHEYTFSNNLNPELTPGSPILFSSVDVPLPYVYAPNGEKAAQFNGTTAHATQVCGPERHSGRVRRKGAGVQAAP